MDHYVEGPEGLIAALVSRPHLPAQVFILEGDNLRQLTHTNAKLLASLQLGEVENITTPTLILCGEKDWNVLVINSEQLYMALKRLGRITNLVVYPGESHSIGTPSYVKDKYTGYLDWFAKYVKGEGN